MSKGKEFPEELTLLEQAIYDCGNIIHDIKNAQKFSDDLHEELHAITQVSELRFKNLTARYDAMERSFMNQKEAGEEMNPLRLEEEEEKIDKDLFGNPTYDPLHNDNGC